MCRRQTALCRLGWEDEDAMDAAEQLALSGSAADGAGDNPGLFLRRLHHLRSRFLPDWLCSNT